VNETPGQHLAVSPDRVRAAGGGRKAAEETQHGLLEALDRLIEPTTARGDPEPTLRWTAKSVQNLASELKSQDFPVSVWLVQRMPHDSGYSLKGNLEVLEGARHPLRDEQSGYINAGAGRVLELGNPVLSADTK
jgi:hypothetical protein